MIPMANSTTSGTPYRNQSIVSTFETAWLSGRVESIVEVLLNWYNHPDQVAAFSAKDLRVHKARENILHNAFVFALHGQGDTDASLEGGDPEVVKDGAEDSVSHAKGPDDPTSLCLDVLVALDFKPSPVVACLVRTMHST